MTVGRIDIDGVVKGIGFAIGPRLALTARHVLVDALDEFDHQKPGCKLKLHAPDGTIYDAELGKCNRRLDIASLVLAADVATWLYAAPAQEAAVDWRVDSRPSDDDPMLTGQITTLARPLLTETGEEVLLIQLHVQQSLGDYRGYSGSPVEYFAPNGQSGGFIGILIEQARWRIKAPGVRLPPVANVLYAVPVKSVLEMLEIENLPELDPEMDAYKVRMKRLKALAAEPDADKKLLRKVEKEVLFRYVFGQ